MILYLLFTLASACTSFCEKLDTDYFGTHWKGGAGASLFYSAIPFDDSCQNMTKEELGANMTGRVITQIIAGNCSVRGNLVAINSDWAAQMGRLCCRNVAVEMSVVLGQVYQDARVAVDECCPRAARINQEDIVAIIVLVITGTFLVIGIAVGVSLHYTRFVRV